MITDAHRERERAGSLPQGRIRGIVMGHEVSPEGRDRDGPGHADECVNLSVTESDVHGVIPGDSVSLRMSEPRDANYLLSDLPKGFSQGGMDPVPDGSEVTFLQCGRGQWGHLETTSYDLDTIERPEPQPTLG